MLLGTIMYSYYTTTYNGRTIHIVKAKSDTNEDVQISLMSWKYDNANATVLLNQFYDSYENSNLEGDGWTRVAVMNGGIFNSQYAPTIFANGLEKSFWVDHEMYDDYDKDGVMAVGHTGSKDSLVIDTQAAIRANGGDYRGCVTSAFGLLKGGSVVHGDILQGEYSSYSGRSIIGKDSSGYIYFISTPGTTGNSSTGLTGDQATALAQSLGLVDAVCLDGGGSTGLIYQGSWKVSTSRKIKNAFALYVKANSGGGGGGGTIYGFQHRDSYTPVYDKVIPHKVYVNGNLVDVKDIQVMTDGELISIDDINVI